VQTDENAFKDSNKSVQKQLEPTSLPVGSSKKLNIHQAVLTRRDWQILFGNEVSRCNPASIQIHSFNNTRSTAQDQAVGQTFNLIYNRVLIYGFSGNTVTVFSNFSAL